MYASPRRRGATATTLRCGERSTYTRTAHSSRPDAPLHALSAHPHVSPADRLGVTAFFAVLAHLIVILGVTFVSEDRPERRITTLDVVLVPQRSKTPPDQADYLAQANQEGSGDSVEKVRPGAPPPAALIAGEATTAAAAPSAAAPAMPADESRPGESAVSPDPAPAPVSIVKKSPAPEPDQGGTPSAGPAAVPSPARDTDTAPPVSRSVAIAALSAEIERKLRAYAERPRRKWISARTREHMYAAYMAAWRRRVEQVGNLNYPSEAARLGLSGSLLLEVALNPDGTVADIELRRSSGRRILDDAAMRIVNLAAPFAEFPPSIADEVDVLHIQRTWIFHSGNRFSSP